MQRVLALAYGFLMALIFAGTYVLGDRSWMAYFLLVPSFLILKAMGASYREPGDSEICPDRCRRSSSGTPGTHLREIKRLGRIGLALILLSIPAALIAESLELNDLAIWAVVLVVLFLTSLVDREFFGWVESTDRHARHSAVD